MIDKNEQLFITALQQLEQIMSIKDGRDEFVQFMWETNADVHLWLFYGAEREKPLTKKH